MPNLLVLVCLNYDLILALAIESTIQSVMER